VSAARTFEVAAVLTDLDGVLVDSTSAVEAAWRRWAAERGVPWEELAVGLHGVRAADTIARFVPDTEVAAETARIDAYELEQLDRSTPIAGGRELVASLPTQRWAVVTSGNRALATGRLDRAGYPRPEVLVSADDVHVGKPDPEGYRAAAVLLGADPRACLVVEDAPAGVAAGKASGATVVAVTTSHPPEELRAADAVVAAPTDLAVRRVGDLLLVSVGT
jgi:sugar-phosphatase